MPPTSSTINTRHQGKAFVVSVLDRRLVEQDHLDRLSTDIHGAVQAAAAKNVIVDFQRVEFLSSSALSILIQLSNRLKEQGGGLAICSLCEPLQQVFKIMKLHKMMKVCEDVDEAAGQFG